MMMIQNLLLVISARLGLLGPDDLCRNHMTALETSDRKRCGFIATLRRSQVEVSSATARLHLNRTPPDISVEQIFGSRTIVDGVCVAFGIYPVFLTGEIAPSCPNGGESASIDQITCLDADRGWLDRAKRARTPASSFDILGTAPRARLGWEFGQGRPKISLGLKPCATGGASANL